jgi:DnaJ-domain-containing protein 1
MSFIYDPFALLGVKVGYDLDLDLLEKKYIDAQKQIHPDQMDELFAGSATSLSALVNQAYADLKNPIMRSQRLLERIGIVVSDKHFGHVPSEVMNLIEDPETNWEKADRILEEEFCKKLQSQDWYGATETHFKRCYINKYFQSKGVKNADSN